MSGNLNSLSTEISNIHVGLDDIYTTSKENNQIIEGKKDNFDRLIDSIQTIQRIQQELHSLENNF